MLQALFDALGEGEQAKLLIEKQGASMVVNVIPLVSRGESDSADSASPDDNVRQLRAALAMPLRLKATPAALDESLCDELREYGQLRSKLKGHKQTLESIREAERKAKQQADKAKADAQKAAKTQQADKAQSEESDTSNTSGETAQGSKQAPSTPKAVPSTDEHATEKGSDTTGGGVKPAPEPTNDNPPSLF